MTPSGGTGGLVEDFCPREFECRNGVIFYYEPPYEICTPQVSRECSGGCVAEGARTSASLGYGLCVGDSTKECTDYFCRDGVVYQSPGAVLCTFGMTEEECVAPCYAVENANVLDSCEGSCATDQPSNDPDSLCGQGGSGSGP